MQISSNRRNAIRKKRIAVAIAGGIGFLAIAAAIAMVLNGSWGSALSHWPQVPPPELFVFTQPKQENVAGVYQLTLQTITKDAAILQGHPCRLDLRLDGSFTVTNYPLWAPEASEPPHVTEFVSTTGRWSFGNANISYRGQECWGVVFSNSTVGINPLALRSKGAPYDLMFIYGDGDEGMVMIFGKKK